MSADELLAQFSHAMKLKPCDCKGQWVKGKWTVYGLCAGHAVLAKYEEYLVIKGNP